MKIENNSNIGKIYTKNNDTYYKKSEISEIKKEIKDYSFASSEIPEPVLRRRLIDERLKLLKPLTEQEYSNIVKKLKSYDYENNPPYVHIGSYINIDSELLGLVPYCGELDTHNSINCWLTGRQCYDLYQVSDERMANLINALDYSLGKLDKKFGKYEGIVYRSGFFNPVTDKEYYSCSSSPMGAIDIAMQALPSPKKQYSIIKQKSGHNIYDFQMYAKNNYSKRLGEIEKEILIDRKTNFRLIPEVEYTQEDKKLKAKFLAHCVTGEKEVTQRDIEFSLEEYGDILKYISIWEEI